MKNSMRYACALFYDYSNARCICLIFFMKSQGICACIFFVCRPNVTNAWLTIYRFFSFAQLNKRGIFLLRRRVWPSSFYIRENVYELCFLFCKKNKVCVLNSFVSKNIHISYFFSVSKVINKIFRSRRYIWCNFLFSLTKTRK